MNITFMKVSTYVLFGILFYRSSKDLDNFYKKEHDADSDESDKNDIFKYIHNCEIRIGIILFFIIINIVAITTKIAK